MVNTLLHKAPGRLQRLRTGCSLVLVLLFLFMLGLIAVAAVTHLFRDTAPWAFSILYLAIQRHSPGEALWVWASGWMQKGMRAVKASSDPHQRGAAGNTKEEEQADQCGMQSARFHDSLLPFSCKRRKPILLHYFA